MTRTLAQMRTDAYRYIEWRTQMELHRVDYPQLNCFPVTQEEALIIKDIPLYTGVVEFSFHHLIFCGLRVVVYPYL